MHHGGAVKFVFLKNFKVKLIIWKNRGLSMIVKGLAYGLMANSSIGLFITVIAVASGIIGAMPAIAKLFVDAGIIIAGNELRKNT